MVVWSSDESFALQTILVNMDCFGMVFEYFQIKPFKRFRNQTKNINASLYLVYCGRFNWVRNKKLLLPHDGSGGQPEKFSLALDIAL